MAVKKSRAKKNKPIRQATVGNLFIQSTYNNTLVTATDLNGNTISWSSSGQCGFKGPKKATPYAAGIILKTLAEKLKGSGLKDVHVYVKGVGGGRDSAVRSINANGFNVLSIKDMTPIPHNGCRSQKPRRM
ncbi:MAG: 30S ribosomal protein S11 [bacterium]|nr:30S ribosomal protein S11 [bacterium]